MKSALITLIAVGGLTVLLSCKQDCPEVNCPEQQTESTAINQANRALTSAACVSFQYEDIVDLTPYIKTDAMAVAERTAFAYNFKCNAGNEAIEEPDVKLNMSVIYGLYDAVDDQPANIRGIRVSLGLNGKKIVYLLENVLLKCSGTETTTGLYTYTPTAIGSKSICNGDGTTSPVTAAQFNNFCNSYTGNIRVRHKQGENYSTMDQGPTWKADTKSVIFSYQELFEYYHSVHECNGGVNDYSQAFYIYNGSEAKGFGEQLDGKDFAEKVNKHTIFFSTEVINTLNPKKLTFATLGITDVANLAHLCPPSCFPVFKVVNKKNCLVN